MAVMCLPVRVSVKTEDTMRKFPFALLGVCALAAPASAYTKADLKAQLKLLMEWWPGDYDNNEQIVPQSGGGLSAQTDKPIYRPHTVFKRLNMPELGDNMLYV
ncbi:MAG: hypothetical protein CK529_07490 [Rhodospirillaceae bacterium]|nr:MAG: hypothetical protein CK529_07490 [Rhodospirillaceae bacterium]